MSRRDTPRFVIWPILEYLGFDNVPQVESGYRKVLCRFHGERDPSASVSKYGFHCFGCERTGDAIKLLRDSEGMGYAEAVEKCHELCGTSGSGVSQQAGWRDIVSLLQGD